MHTPPGALRALSLDKRDGPARRSSVAQHSRAPRCLARALGVTGHLLTHFERLLRIVSRASDVVRRADRRSTRGHRVVAFGSRSAVGAARTMPGASNISARALRNARRVPRSAETDDRRAALVLHCFARPSRKAARPSRDRSRALHYDEWIRDIITRGSRSLGDLLRKDARRSRKDARSPK